MKQIVYLYAIFIAGISFELAFIVAFYQFRQRPSIASYDNNRQQVSIARTAFETCKAPSGFFARIYRELSSSDRRQGHRRNFDKDPIRVGGSDFPHGTRIYDCPVGCYHYPPEGKLAANESGFYFDASFVDEPDKVRSRDYMGLSILRTMESPHYRPEARLRQARTQFDVVMTTRLDSDVPVPYFSWHSYNFMKKPRNKTTEKIASGFFSNCDPLNFRQKAIDLLMNSSLSNLVDLFGLCSKAEKRFQGEKLDVIRRHKFHLAFENSNHADYVTEKFFQSLEEGTVPVVIGAPNIGQFAPSNNSFLHIRKLEDVPKIASRMVELSKNDFEYEAMLDWKRLGPSAPFKALMDLSIVHSSCRLCIHLADRIRRKERQEQTKKENECRCEIDKTTSVFRFFVRERGRFRFEQGFLFDWEINLNNFAKAILAAFTTKNGVYRPIWTRQRDEKGRRSALWPFSPKKARPVELKLYRIYAATTTQGKALFGKKAPIDSDAKVSAIFARNNDCLYFEVIFV